MHTHRLENDLSKKGQGACLEKILFASSPFVLCQPWNGLNSFILQLWNINSQDENTCSTKLQCHINISPSCVYTHTYMSFISFELYKFSHFWHLWFIWFQMGFFKSSPTFSVYSLAPGPGLEMWLLCAYTARSFRPSNYSMSPESVLDVSELQKSFAFSYRETLKKN